MPGGNLRTKECSSNVYQFATDNTGQVSNTFLIFSEVYGKCFGAQPWCTISTDEVDYELHLETKLNFLLYFITRQLTHSEMTLLQSQGELEHTQMLTFLLFAIQNTRLASYMLTGNTSLFLDTDGSVDWWYSCPKFLSLLRKLDEFFDRLPILFEWTTKILDPVTRQIYNFAYEISCLGDYTDVFQTDLENDNSLYQVLFEVMPFNKRLLFKPTELGQINQFPIFDTRRAVIYAPKQKKLLG